jgi:hypothetical protein
VTLGVSCQRSPPTFWRYAACARVSAPTLFLGGSRCRGLAAGKAVQQAPSLTLYLPFLVTVGCGLAPPRKIIRPRQAPLISKSHDARAKHNAPPARAGYYGLWHTGQALSTTRCRSTMPSSADMTGGRPNSITFCAPETAKNANPTASNSSTGLRNRATPEYRMCAPFRHPWAIRIAPAQ